MTELLTAVRTIAFIISQIRLINFKVLVQPVLTACMLSGFYITGHIVREGSVAEGLHMAFLDNERLRNERQRKMEDAIVQAELHYFVEANRLIDQLLESALQRAKSAARARLDIIHNGVTGLTGIGLLRYDVTHSVAAAGRSTGALVANRPMSEWTDFLPALLAGQCVINHSGELRSAAVRARFDAMGVANFLVCPAADVQGKLLGAVFVLWDQSDQLPPPDELAALMANCRQIGAQIAAVLDLRGLKPLLAQRS